MQQEKVKLIGIYQTDTKLIRIDQLRDDTFRYAAWPKSKSISSEPELILQGGETGIIESKRPFVRLDRKLRRH